MRIAYVINSVEGGGAASPVPAIAGALRAQGAEVRLFALTGRDRRALPAIAAAGLDPIMRDGGETDHIAAMWWLAREIRQWGATHIWTSLSRATIIGLTLGPRLGLPVISWQHNAFLKPWNRRLLRLLQSRATLWVCDSQSVADLTAQRLGVKPERLVCWPIFSTDPTMPNAPAWQPGEAIRVGSLGRLHTAKGYDVLIAALARLKTNGFAPPAPVEIRIAGEGTERDRLAGLAMEAGLENVYLTGFADPRAFLADLHLYLQPSRREGFCIAAHEAMSAGLPVIASAVGELTHSIEEGMTGHLAPPDDPVMLANVLRHVFTNPERLKPMGAAARLRVQDRFSRQKFLQCGANIANVLSPTC